MMCRQLRKAMLVIGLMYAGTAYALSMPEAEGDFDRNGYVEASDAAFLLRSISDPEASKERFDYFDITSNGVLSRSDAKLLLMTAASKTDSVKEAAQFLGNSLLGEEYLEKFSYRHPVVGDRFYRSSNISAEEYEFEFQNSICHVVDVYVRDIRCIGSAFSSQTFKGKRQYPASIARNANAIYAITGDMYLKNADGAFVRNGVWYDKNKGLTKRKDICVLYKNGTLEIFSKGKITVEELEKGESIWQLWAFGPMLLDEDGMPMQKFQCSPSILGNNPRSAIGYYGPGHYCLVVVDGRQKPFSSGLNMEDMSDLMFQLGCTAAYNLDGGQSAAMVGANGRLLSNPSGGGRTISDIVMVVEPRDE